MIAETVVTQLVEGTVLEGPHWTEPVRVLTAKVRGSRIEVQAVGAHTKRLWTKLLKPEEFGDTIKVTQAGKLAALNGNPTHFRLAAEAHRIRLAYPVSSSLTRSSVVVSTRISTVPFARAIHAPPW